MQNISSNALLRLLLPQVLALIPVSRSAWWAGCKSGRYPKPVKLGPRNNGVGERRILPRFWKSSPPNRRKNEHRFFPALRPFTPAWMPEADIPSRPCPVGLASRALMFMPRLPASLHSRATDEESLRRGLLSKGSPQTESTKATTQKRFPPLTAFPHTDTRRTRCSQACPGVRFTEFSPDTYDVASRSAFRCPRRHVHHADLALCRILTAQFSYDVQGFCRIPSPHVPDGYLEPSIYPPATRRIQPAPRLIRTRHVPDARIMRLRFRTDACSFVRHCLRGLAYVSSYTLRV